VEVELYIPRHVERLNIDWTDGELVFLNFWFKITKEHGWDTRYYIHPKDICAMLCIRQKKSKVHFQNLKKVMHFGMLADYTWVIENKKIPKQGFAEWARVTQSENFYKITDTEAIAKHYYVQALLFHKPDLVVNHETGKEIVWTRQEEGSLLPVLDKNWMKIRQ
jgi:hypothetical protein